jgi:putative inorganic carbon (hco3(-)) transporter
MNALNERQASLPTRAAEFLATYGLAAVVLCLPLEFTSVLFRQQLSRFVLVIVAAAFFYLVVTGRRRPVFPRFLSVYLLLAYIAVSLISWLLTRAPGSAGSLLDIALYPVVALLAANIAVSQRDHRRAWIAFLASALAVALLGAFLYVTHLQVWTPNPAVASRMNITFGDPNITARFLTLGACAAVIVYASRQGPSWLTVAAAVGCAVVIPLTFSRSGLALFIISVAIAIGFALNRRRAAAIGVAALLAFVTSTGVNPDTRQRATDAAFTAVSAVTGATAPHGGAAAGHHQAAVASADNRKYLVAAGLKMGVDHPMFGVGFGGYQHALLTTYNRYLPTGYTDSVSHTSMVTVFAEQGIVGALLMVALLIQLGRETLAARWRRDAWSLWATVPATLVIPIVLYSQFEGRFFQEPYLWLTLGMLYSAMLAQRGASAVAEPRGSDAAAAEAA